MHKEIREALRQYDTGDAWGDTWSAWFAIAGVLDIQGEDVPDSWRYRPATSLQTEAGLRKDNDMAGYLIDEFEARLFDAEDLRRAGNVLERYVDMLRNAGRDY